MSRMKHDDIKVELVSRRDGGSLALSGFDECYNERISDILLEAVRKTAPIMREIYSQDAQRKSLVGAGYAPKLRMVK